jgi:hypothetical protein
VAEGLPAAEAPAALAEELDQLDLGPGWADQRQRIAARDMLDRFLRWHAANGRELVAAEADFDVTVGRARIRGQVDRLERDGAGRLVVVDLKTGRTAARDIDTHGSWPPTRWPSPPARSASTATPRRSGAAAGRLREQGQGAGTGPAARRRPGGGDLGRGAGGAGRRRHGRGTFEVRTGSHCSRCPARRSCPLHERGRQVTS